MKEKKRLWTAVLDGKVILTLKELLGLEQMTDIHPFILAYGDAIVARSNTQGLIVAALREELRKMLVKELPRISPLPLQLIVLFEDGMQTQTTVFSRLKDGTFEVRRSDKLTDRGKEIMGDNGRFFPYKETMMTAYQDLALAAFLEKIK